MATTVNAAFEEFLREEINLDVNQVSQARSSLSWLLGQIQALPGRQTNFPLLWAAMDIQFGSFARGTKKRPLDDIDLIVGLNGTGASYLDTGGSVTITVHDDSPLRSLCHDGTSRLNSRRVINKFVGALSGVPQYQSADIKRTGEAAVLDLVSYPWAFDIVPGFFTSPEWDGREFYIIPDGQGEWKKTDPRKDRDRAAVIAGGGRSVLDVVRLAKYWNERPTMPGMSPYLIECIVLNYFEANGSSGWPDLDFINALPHVASSVLYNVPDPKGIQGNINYLGVAERVKISQRALDDSATAVAAHQAEAADNHREAIRLWGRVFGPAFPIFY